MADEKVIDRAALPAFGRLDEWFGMALVEPSRGLRLFDHLSGMFKSGALGQHIAATLSRQAALTPAERLEDHRQRKLYAVARLERAERNGGQEAGGGRGGNADGLEDTGGTETMGVRPDGEPYRCAVIELAGTLMKSPSSMDAATSTVYAREQVRLAAADSAIDAILIRIDSPGGYVSGTEDLAAAIRAASAAKPVMGYIEDLCASAALWCGVACGTAGGGGLWANNVTAQVGSIGVVMGFYEAVGMAGMQGLKPVVISTGAYKGMGFPGTEITAEQRAKLQESVDQTMEQFVAVVAQGRKLTPAAVRAMGTGEVWGALAATKKGLIDGIASYEQVLAKLGAEVLARSQKAVRSQKGNSEFRIQNSELPHTVAGTFPAAGEDAPTIQPAAAPGGGEPNKEHAMSDATKDAPTNSGPKAASLKELKAALPTSSAEFREECLEKGLTLEQAAIAHASATSAELVAERAKKPVGTAALGGGGAGAEGQDFSALVLATMAQYPALDRRAAIAKTAKEHPEAHEAYKAACPKATAANARK